MDYFSKYYDRARKNPFPPLWTKEKKYNYFGRIKK